jgi:molybdopterin/thiamine biosynthesis adenylyltransferase
MSKGMLCNNKQSILTFHSPFSFCMLYEELFFRNKGTLSVEEQLRLKTSKVAIIGLGGTGGFVLENLLRLGVEDFVLFDPDRFELSNMNRQLLATFGTIDKRKTTVASIRTRRVNPDAKFRLWTQHFTASDSTKLAGCSIVFDCTDNLESRFEIAKACKKVRVPFVFCSASFTRGMVSVFSPNAAFEKIFGHLKNTGKTCASVICPAPALAASLAAYQGLCVLTGRPAVHAPEFIIFDLAAKKILWRQKL